MVGKILSTRMLLELEKATQHQGIIDVSIYFSHLTSGTHFYKHIKHTLSLNSFYLTFQF